VKLAAMEGIWETEKGADLRLFAIPDQQQETNYYEVTIPKAASPIIKHDINGEIAGLDQVAKEDRPPVPVVFFSFRIMLGLGGLMLLLGLAGWIARRRGRMFESKPLLTFSVLMIPAGVIATLAGWYVVEVGRQPWLVQGLVRTTDVVSPLPAQSVAFSLALFVTVYSILFMTYLYFMRKLVRKGPATIESLLNDQSTHGQDEDLPATLNPAQVDVGYTQEMSDYIDAHNTDTRKGDH